MEKTLSIKTVSVEIHVVRVDGHKMTLSTFKQIPEEEYQFLIGSKLLGWVKAPAPWAGGHDSGDSAMNQEGRWLLVTKSGVLLKAFWPGLKDQVPGKQIYIAT